MRIYAKFKNVGTEYDTYAPEEISLTPFRNACWTAELNNENLTSAFFNNEGVFSYSDGLGKWQPYNVTIANPCFYNPENGIFHYDWEEEDDDEDDDYDYVSGFCCTKYKNGKIIKKDYFSEYLPEWLALK